MNESSKTRRVRGDDFEAAYLSGRVLDIGCGADPVVPHADPFDKAQGDANTILRYLQPGTYDTVHSSHCLEHMENPTAALRDWWQLVRPGGHLITVVPDEDLYEQGIWPSRFNGDHRATFRLDKAESWSPVSYDILQLHLALPGSTLISAEVHDDGYRRELMHSGSETPAHQNLRSVYRRLILRFDRHRWLTVPMLDEINVTFAEHGLAVDQTLGSALAQIQVIVRKGFDGSLSG